MLKAFFRNNWCERVSFEVCDAARPQEKYVDSRNSDITHIYSYNKVMSLDDRKNISKILNRTNFKIMAWYFGPRDSAKAGLKRVRLAYKMPMHSTGKEKFTVYVYFKTEKYDPANPWSDSESDADSVSSEIDSRDNLDSNDMLSDDDMMGYGVSQVNPESRKRESKSEMKIEVRKNLLQRRR